MINLSQYRQQISRYTPKYGKYGAIRKPPTQTQLETIPYAQQVEEEKRRKKARLSPIDIIFNILQTGQFMTANMAEEITSSVREGEPLGQALKDIGQAILEGLTWKKKGTFKETIFGREGTTEKPGFEGWWQDLPEGLEANEPWIRGKKGGGILRPQNVIGALADIILDPFTWINPFHFFKVTGTAKNIAKEWAEHAVMKGLKEIPGEVGEALAIKGKAIAGGNLTNLTKSLKNAYGKAGNWKAVKHLDDLWRKGYREALHKPQKQLFSEAQEAFAKEFAKGEAMDMVKLGTIQKSIDLAKASLGSGTKTMRVLGKEFWVKERGPDAAEKSWAFFRDAFAKARIPAGKGLTVGDAWWSVMNRGAVGGLRRAFGFRNPYQKMVHLKAKDIDHSQMAKIMGDLSTYRQVRTKISDVDLETARKVMSLAEEMWTPRKPIGHKEVIDNILSQGGTWHGISLTPGQADTVKSYWDDVKGLTDNFLVKENEMAAKGLLLEAPEMENYMMGPMKDIGRKAIKTKVGAQKTFTQEKHIQSSVQRIKFMFGDRIKEVTDDLGVNVDDYLKDFLVKNNLADVSLNLDEIFVARATVHNQLMKRANIIETFREFGIPIQEMEAMSPGIASHTLKNIHEIGMGTVKDPAFEGLLFDKEVAEIFKRSVDVMGDDMTMQSVKGMMGRHLQWWKGIVTLTSGFHIRNLISNQMTGFLRFGPRWFNMKKWMGPSIVGTAYALHPEKYIDILKNQFKFTDGFIARNLNKRIGDLTVKELAEKAHHLGAISPRTMAFDPNLQAIAKTGKKSLNILKRQNVFFDVSRGVGDQIENSSKFQMFLMNYEDMWKVGGGENIAKALPEMGNITPNQIYLERAAFDTKKWLIDYCFDEKTEILTDKGWRTYQTILEKDKALTFNMDTDKLEWSEIENIHISYYEGELNHLSNKRFDALVTDNHKWVKLGGDVGGHWSIIKPKYQLKKTKELGKPKLKMSCPRCDDFKLEIYSDAFIRLVGWVLTEGTYPKKTLTRKNRSNKNICDPKHVIFYQSIKHNPHYVREIRKLVKHFSEISESAYTYPNGVKIFYIKAKLGKIIRDLFPKKELTLDFILTLSHRQREILLEILLKGDGSCNKGGHWEFGQKSLSFIDAFQVLCFLIGRRTVIRKTWDGKTYSVSVLKPDKYMVYENLRKEKQLYKGKIWCITTSNHTLVARRNGTIYISGNSDLSPFEQKVMKNVQPFYAWIRNNLSNQLSGLLLYPEMYSMIPKSRSALKDDEDFDYFLQPDWQKNLSMYPIGKDEQGRFIMFRPDFPYKDLNLIPITFDPDDPLSHLPQWDWREAINDIMATAHPMIKWIAETLPEKGWNFFRRKEIKDWERAPLLMQYMVKSPGIVTFIDGAMRLAGFDEGLKINVEKGQIEIDGKTERFLENNIPVLRTIAMVLELGEEAADLLTDQEVEIWIERISGKRDYYEGLEELFQIMSSTLGVKLKTLDLSREAEAMGREIEKEAQARRIEENRAANPLAYQQRRASSLKAYRTRLRNVGLGDYLR